MNPVIKTQNNTVPQEFDALVIGAGFSGMYQLLCLRDKLKMSVKVLEAGAGIGGTWYWNRYPGARCDSESHTYSYYFSKELLQDWEWTERYPQQPEILSYLNYVADKFNLKPDIELNTKVTAARYDEASNRWHVQTDSGQLFICQFLIAGVGCLSSTNTPQIRGLDQFKGKSYHTAQWPHEGVDFKGKHVGVIGTGSTGIQAIPVIAEQSAHLTVFQRTANYSLPARNAPLTTEFKKYLKENSDSIREIMHSTTNGHSFRILDRSVHDVNNQEREAIYEEAWKKGGLQFRASFGDILLDKSANDTAAEFIIKKIRQSVKDPVKAAILSDIDHPFAAKRPPIDNYYFETYNRDNVDLVDLRSEPIETASASGLKTSRTHYDLDILVFATGFDAMTGTFLKMDIQGLNGVTLKDIWHDGPLNYLGLQVPGFPNFFTITGPGSPSVLCNVPVAIEQHVEWITTCIDHMRKEGFKRIEADTNASNEWLIKVNEAAHATLLPTVKHSWYLGANIPGKPRVFMPYAGGLARYRKICDEIAHDQYRGFIFN
ncbi:MAG: NAD(P)/FAD-dependent oxidoreductase [Limnohabitans sp.]|nr:NAD(P)/FAD-dependent oxidoreductase [Limnohabitans sp.]